MEEQSFLLGWNSIIVVWGEGARLEEAIKIQTREETASGARAQLRQAAQGLKALGEELLLDGRRDAHFWKVKGKRISRMVQPFCLRCRLLSYLNPKTSTCLLLSRPNTWDLICFFSPSSHAASPPGQEVGCRVRCNRSEVSSLLYIRPSEVTRSYRFPGSFPHPPPSVYSFILLHWILVITHGTLNLWGSMQTLSCSMWDLVHWLGIEPMPPEVWVWIRSVKS